MKMKDFELAAQRHSEITKAAFISAVGGMLKSLGGMVLRNPGKALTAGLAATDESGGVKSGVKAVTNAKAPSGTFLVGPTI